MNTILHSNTITKPHNTKVIGSIPERNPGVRTAEEVRRQNASKSNSVPADIMADTSPELQTKEQLIIKIREWVKIDNEMRVLQKELKKRTSDKKKVSEELIQVMNAHQIDAFNTNDGQILYDKRNVKKPITKTALLAILTSYYNGDAVKASETNQYILENREEVVREKIVRKIVKPATTNILQT
jgi:hypothetical protein